MHSNALPARLLVMYWNIRNGRLLSRRWHRQYAVLRPVIFALQDRYQILKDNWREAVEENDKAPEFHDATFRARVSELNYILGAIVREFPNHHHCFPDGEDPFELEAEMRKGRRTQSADELEAMIAPRPRAATSRS